MSFLERPKAIVGGTVYDGTGKPPVKDGVVVILGPYVLDVGPSTKVDVPKNAEVIDAKGKTVMPGFIDSHTHFIGMGTRTLTSIDLSQTKSIPEALKLVKDRVAQLPKGTWVSGRGWDESKWAERRYVTRVDLDPVSPDHPVVLTRVCGHLLTANSRALEAANVTKDVQDPPGGKIDKDPKTGELTGVFKDAGGVVNKAMPPTPRDVELDGLRRACQIALELGCTSIHDAGAPAESFNLYQTVYNEGRLGVRCYPMPRGEILLYLDKFGVVTGFGNEFLRIGCVKLQNDGSLGAHTAALFEPYASDSSTRGILRTSPEDLMMRVSAAHKLGYQVAIHSIGDWAIEEAINAFEAALKEMPREDHRHRIEHCELLNDDQIARIKRLKIIPSVQPNFVGEWEGPGGMYETRVGQTRLRRMNPFRKLLDQGIKICFGSDGMPFHPIYGLWSAVNHWIPESRITVEEGKKAFTLDAAYASFEEKIKGSLEKGKLADIAILAEDLSTIPAGKIRDVKVDMTIVGGNIAYQRSK